MNWSIVVPISLIHVLCRLGNFFYNRQQFSEINNFQLFNYSPFFLLLISHVHYIHTFDCICDCVNFVHECSFSVIFLCILIRCMLTETNKQTNMYVIIDMCQGLFDQYEIS